MLLFRVRKDNGSVDPILIVAGIAITLLLLVGGLFAMSGFRANAQNTNTKADLERIAIAQSSRMALDYGFGRLAQGPLVLLSELDGELLLSPVTFTPGFENSLVVSVCEDGWAALGHSASGDAFIRTSESSGTVSADLADVGALNITAAAKLPDCLVMPTVAQDWLDATTGSATPAPPPTVGVADQPDAITPGSGDYTLTVSWNQMAPKQTCATVTVIGTGGLTAWSANLDTRLAPFNNGNVLSNYQIGWGYVLSPIAGGVTTITGNIANTTQVSSSKSVQFTVCNYNLPYPAIFEGVLVNKTLDASNVYNPCSIIQVSVTARFYVGWAFEFDATELHTIFQGAGGQLVPAGPGNADVSVTHISGEMYRIQGVGWNTSGIRTGTPSNVLLCWQ